MAEFPFREISRLYHEDADFRAAADKDARAALAEQNVHFDGPGEVRLAADTEDTMHIVFPPNPNASIPDDALDGVAGGLSSAFSHGYSREWYSAGGRYDSSR